MTNEDAQDLIFAKFKAAWDAKSAAVNGGAVPEVEWPNVERVDGNGNPLKPLSEGNKPWARITVRHSTGDQRTLGEVGSRRFTRTGTAIVQVFVPAGKRGLVTGDRLGNVALDAFEGEESGDVWFKNVVQREIGVDGAWHQTNVYADFEYDVVK